MKLSTARLFVFLLTFGLVQPPPAYAQAAGITPQAWNDARTMELVRSAIARRSLEVVDTALQNYSAEGRGYIYFLLDAPELERQTLVRTDQVAVEVFWRAPNEARQRIIGLREQRELPVSRLHYYLDRMTVVQDGYGESIVIADGDNVNDVPHPIGPTGEASYDYRLVDSLTLRLPGVENPVRVHEVQVRPRSPERPAVVGSIFLEAATAALVRMNFTFTPASYVDPRLDYINVNLENGLWRGRFWLPHEQRLEIRREIPELDLPFGTIIRTRMRVGDYRFNEDLPPIVFMSPTRITVAPRAERESFPFETPIDAEWRLEGFGEPASVEEVRRIARNVLREQAVSGLPRGRLSANTASDVFRYNRAEGVSLGLGVSIRPTPEISGRVHGGWAFAARHPFGVVSVGAGHRLRLDLSGHLNRRGDVGGVEAVSGVFNTLGSLLIASDYTDPYYASGGEASLRYPAGGLWTARGSMLIERQRSATAATDFSIFELGDGFRPVREIDPGDRIGLTAGVRREPRAVASGWWFDATAGLGRLVGTERTFDFGRAQLAGGATWSWSARRTSLELEGRLGASAGEVPLQEVFLLGGRGTLPGFGYRTLGGDRIALARTSASADLTHPWLRGRISGAVGWIGSGRPDPLDRWSPTRSGTRGSVGVGLGIFYDLIRVDVARGIGAGTRTQLIIEAQPTFWGFL